MCCTYASLQSPPSSQISISCESVGNFHWSFAGSIRTCSMTSSTQISSQKTILTTADDKAKGINFQSNKKIQYLPVGIHLRLPALTTYSASHCALKEISYENFFNLEKLKYLWLDFNQIESIDSSVFEDLTSVIRIDLRFNKIKVMSGWNFANLPKLTYVGITNNNNCVTYDFNGISQIADIPKIVKRCQTKASMVKDLQVCKDKGPRVESKNVLLRNGIDNLYAEMKLMSGIDFKAIIRSSQL
jgi:Leucine rich repeat